MPSGFTVRPLTADTWARLEDRFGRPGGSIVQGCRSRSRYERAGLTEVVRR